MERCLGFVVFEVCVLCLVVRDSLATVKYFSMDTLSLCRSDAVRALLLNDNDIVIILAKSKENDSNGVMNVQYCRIILGPSAESKKNNINLQFKSFSVPSCDVQLFMEQSPSATFDRAVTELGNLHCLDRNPDSITAESGHLVKITLHRKTLEDIKTYNFRINVTLIDSESKSMFGISLGIKIAIATASVVVAVIVILLVYKAVRKQLSIKREHGGETSLPMTNLEILQHSRTARSNSYMSVPGVTFDTSQQNLIGDSNYSILQNPMDFLSSSSSNTDRAGKYLENDEIQSCLPHSDQSGTFCANVQERPNQHRPNYENVG